MKQRLHKKLRSQTGESIAETLISVLISSVALLLLAGMVAASTRLVARSRSLLDDYYQAGNSIAAHSASAMDVAPTTVTVSKAESSDITGSFHTESFDNVRIYENTELGSVSVMSYALPEATPQPTDP